MARKIKNDGTKPTKEQIIDEVVRLLDENKEWEKRYKNYIKEINIVHKQEANYKNFRTPEQLSRYCSITYRDGKTYDLRYEGQSVAEVKFTSDEVRLVPKIIASNFGFQLNDLEEKKGWEWSKKRASEFRSHFKNHAQEYEINTQPEHRLENRMLRLFSSSKKPFSIRPVQLFKCFFQMPTPLSASTHDELPSYAGYRGGGIDILARVTPQKPVKGEGSRLCVIELKDEIKKNESQSDAMGQAVAYAVFITRLLRNELGQKWYDFFMREGNEATSKGDVPEDLEIDVVTIMPEGATEEFSNRDLILPKYRTTLHCHSLYYDNVEFAQGRGSIVFDKEKSTYLEEVKLK